MKLENTTPSASLSFPPAARVRAKADYSRVFEGAKRTADPLMVLHRVAADTPARLGLAVSRKVSLDAVVRNRIKRVLRDQFRRLRPQLQGGDCVIVARTAAATASGDQLRAAFISVLRRSGALSVQADTMSAKQKVLAHPPHPTPDSTSG